MSAHNRMGRPGGSSESPGRARLEDKVVDFFLTLVLSLAPLALFSSVGLTAWWYLSPALAIAVTVALVAIAIMTARGQWWWFRSVFFRRSVPAKFRQIGLVNRTGQTPPVKRVKWRGPIVTLCCSTHLGHPRELFEQRRAELAAVMGAESVRFEQVRTAVVITAVRRSAFDEEQPQSWT